MAAQDDDLVVPPLPRPLADDVVRHRRAPSAADGQPGPGRSGGHRAPQAIAIVAANPDARDRLVEDVGLAEAVGRVHPARPAGLILEDADEPRRASPGGLAIEMPAEPDPGRRMVDERERPVRVILARRDPQEQPGVERREADLRHHDRAAPEVPGGQAVGIDEQERTFHAPGGRRRGMGNREHLGREPVVLDDERRPALVPGRDRDRLAADRFEAERLELRRELGLDRQVGVAPRPARAVGSHRLDPAHHLVGVECGHAWASTASQTRPLAWITALLSRTIRRLGTTTRIGGAAGSFARRRIVAIASAATCRAG